MISLKEAIKIAEADRQSKVTSASDCGDRWALTFECDEPFLPPALREDSRIPDWAKSVLSARQGLPAFVYKDSGAIEYFFTAGSLDVLESAKRIDLPKEEQCSATKTASKE